MTPLGWVFVGAVGIGATYISLTTDSDQLAIVSGLIGLVTCLLFAFLSLEIVLYEDGIETTKRYPAMAAWGLAMAAPNLYVALTGPLEIVRDRDQLREEVTG